MSQDTRSQGVNDEAHADGIGRPMTHSSLCAAMAWLCRRGMAAPLPRKADPLGAIAEPRFTRGIEVPG